jgi:hypothetical protein
MDIIILEVGLTIIIVMIMDMVMTMDTGIIILMNIVIKRIIMTIMKKINLMFTIMTMKKNVNISMNKKIVRTIIINKHHETLTLIVHICMFSEI